MVLFQEHKQVDMQSHRLPRIVRPVINYHHFATIPPTPAFNPTPVQIYHVIPTIPSRICSFKRMISKDMYREKQSLPLKDTYFSIFTPTLSSFNNFISHLVAYVLDVVLESLIRILSHVLVGKPSPGQSKMYMNRLKSGLNHRLSTSFTFYPIAPTPPPLPSLRPIL